MLPSYTLRHANGMIHDYLHQTRGYHSSLRRAIAPPGLDANAEPAPVV